MELMMPTDSVFLLGESREHPMHVGGLQLYEPPQGAGRDFVREFYDHLVAQQDFQPTFLKRPATVMGGIANLAWTYDKDVDIDYHVRRSALPSPGRVRELLELTSRWHSTLLDRHRPLWEAHVIEGLKDGRFAIYTKMHHSLIDGVSALKLMQRAMSDDPDDPEVRATWSVPKRKRKSSRHPR
jgi:WS/DGAT/MGAT family acyltransferase